MARANDEPQHLPIKCEAAALPGTPSKGIFVLAHGRNSQGPRSGRFRILSFGVSYIRGVEASQKRNGDTSKGIGPPSPAATFAAWPLVRPIGRLRCFRDLRIQFGAAGPQ